MPTTACVVCSDSCPTAPTGRSEGAYAWGRGLKDDCFHTLLGEMGSSRATSCPAPAVAAGLFAEGGPIHRFFLSGVSLGRERPGPMPPLVHGPAWAQEPPWAAPLRPRRSLCYLRHSSPSLFQQERRRRGLARPLAHGPAWAQEPPWAAYIAATSCVAPLQASEPTAHNDKISAEVKAIEKLLQNICQNESIRPFRHL